MESRHNLIRQSEGLSRDEYRHIFRLFRDADVNFTENHNGILINLQKVDDEVVERVSAQVQQFHRMRSENSLREAQLKEYEDEMQGTAVPASNPTIVTPPSNFFTEIRNAKNLNAMERSILKENHANSIAQSARPTVTQRRSMTRRYTGVQAKILRNCKNINRTNSSSMLASGRQAEDTLADAAGDAEVQVVDGVDGVEDDEEEDLEDEEEEDIRASDEDLDDVDEHVTEL
ncbi:hypothetical protein CVIRNUC_004609 [Coccomyxa viridis]|uniref:Uncharacterized protein n=2 Tax=Coccomyxa viridis TaxID=1274662 RepID=A0AAV1I2Z7_9CHLO|nr:hypothetical protein CVIRNUC_004609 [Coccomyxa viridis]